MVESPALVQEGIKSGYFKEDSYIMIGGSVHRVCAPPLGNERMYSLIFWEKEDAEDNHPTLDKIVSNILLILFMVFSNFQFGGVIYNIEKLNTSFSLQNGHTQVESNVSKTLTL
jgi:hypothetical protein